MFSNKLFLVLFLAAALSLGILCFPIRSGDYLLFEALTKSSHPEESQAQLTFSRQKREQVSKQIWFQNEPPLLCRIDSKESDLFFVRNNDHIEVVEELNDVCCVMQEELYYLLPGGKETISLLEAVPEAVPMQRFRYLEAKKACYNYLSNLFIAEDVKLWKFQTAGHAFPTPPFQSDKLEPLMQAEAESVEFTFQDAKIDFIAHHMRAMLNHNFHPRGVLHL